jgi:hypothetical protein
MTAPKIPSAGPVSPGPDDVALELDELVSSLLARGVPQHGIADLLHAAVRDAVLRAECRDLGHDPDSCHWLLDLRAGISYIPQGAAV